MPANLIKRLHVIKLQIEFETSVMELYQAFADEFVYCSLWVKLVPEEKRHVSWLKGLEHKVMDLSADYEKCVFSAEKLTEAVNKVKKLKDDFIDHPFSIGDALEYAAGIESSFYEKDFLTFFDSDSQDLKKTLALLMKESRTHREMIDSEARKYI